MSAKRFDGAKELPITADRRCKVVLAPEPEARAHPCGCDPAGDRHYAVWMVQWDAQLNSEHTTKFGTFCSAEHADRWVSRSLLALVPKGAIPSREVLDTLAATADQITTQELERLMNEAGDIFGDDPDEAA